MTGLGLDGVLPVIGSKELIGSMALHLGIGAGDLIGYPALAYPTYEVGAALAGADSLATDSLTAFGPRTPRLLWLNSPANPTRPGAAAGPPAQGRRLVPRARHDPRLRRVLHRVRVVRRPRRASRCRSSTRRSTAARSTGILAVHSLSKRSNLAGYRCAFVAGDPALVGELLAVRKNLGLQMPGPQQRAMIAALDDDAHVDVQHATYAARRLLLKEALEAAGFRIDHSEASLYLWATRGEDCWQTVAALAEQGILVAPGEFYGPPGRQHVRVAFTATDERVAAAVARLAAG